MASRSVSLGRLPRAIPALLTRMSRRPYSRSIQSAARWTDPGSVASSRTKRALAPAPRSARSASRPRSSSRAAASTVAPRAPSCRPVSSPIPLLAPVTRAIVVVMASTVGGPPPTWERPANAGISGPTLGAAATGGQGPDWKGELDQPGRPGGVPAGQAGPAPPAPGRAARNRRSGPAPDAGAAAAGGRPAGRPVRGLLHPARAGARAAPVAAGAVRPRQGAGGLP